MTAWRNWSGLETASPGEQIMPSGVAEVQDVVRRAADSPRGVRRVKMTGSGHSFTGIARPEEVLLRPEGLTGISVVDRSTYTVTARSGTLLKDLNRDLARLGLSLHNMGDIDEQTLAGAISTGTHGTGGVMASISAQVVGVELVDGTGEVRTFTIGDEHYDSVRLGLGALGIITALTFGVEPLFGLEASEGPLTWDALLTDYDHLLDTHHHCDLMWFPHTDTVLAKCNRRVADLDELEPVGPVDAWVNEFTENTAFGLVNRIGDLRPATRPALARISGRLLSERSYSDIAHRVFTSPRRVVFREMEYAVPREAAIEALTECRARIERSDWKISFPVEIRSAPGDDLTLSTASGRDSLYLAFHVNARTDHTDYFSGIEEVLRSFDGRPHWGKLHTRTAADLEPAYPRWAEFQAARDALDPHRVFSNAYLERVLGP